MELTVLHAEIDRRVMAIREAALPEWPCRVGCDACCRSLAALPELSEAEWLYLQQGFSALEEDALATIGARLEEQAGRTGPYVCPMLELNTGRCAVYAHRPVACRTYGYYLERDKGLYCGIILGQVERGERDGVVWGNDAAVAASLVGARRGLVEWWRGISKAEADA